MTVLDREDYPSIGSGSGGRSSDPDGRLRRQRSDHWSPDGFLAAFVMLVGIGFLTVITAAITRRS